MATKAQLAQYCADHFPSQIVNSGISMTHVIIVTGISLLAGFGIGWYFKGRGMTGVKIDMTNAAGVVKTDAQKVETAVTAAV